MVGSSFLKPDFVAWRTAAEVEHLSLVHSRRGDFIVTGGDESFFVLLGDRGDWFAYPAAGNDSWSGTTVGPCDIEVDVESATPEEDRDPLLGSIVRRGNRLLLIALPGAQSYNGPFPIRLARKLSGPAQPLGVWFARWRLVLWDGDRREILREFDVSPQP